MRKQLNIYIIILTALCFSLNSYAQTRIDSLNSSVSFSISNMKFNTVEGKFKSISGNGLFNSSSLNNSFFNVCINAASIDTENKKRDKHLKNEDFFNVSKYPTICFRSSNIYQDQDTFIAQGTLTILGKSKSIKIPFTSDGSKVSGSFTINRFDFDLGEGTGSFLVGEEVNIRVECQLQ